MEKVMDMLMIEIFGNPIANYLICIFIFWVSLIAVKIVKFVLFKRLKKFAESTKGNLDDFVVEQLEKTLMPILYAGVFYFSLKQLILNEAMGKLVNTVGLIVLVIQATRIILAVILKILVDYWAKKQTPVSSSNTATNAIRSLVTIGGWSLALVFLLDNLGFNVSAVIAGLGVGGVAVALAAQTILGDLFNYFVIFFDKPFEEGDTINAGEEFLGEIEYIGLKSTRIRSLSGEQLVLSNTDLTSSRIRNLKRMNRRRVNFELGLVYQTSNTKMHKAVQIVKDIIHQHKEVAYDRVHFKTFADFSLNIDVVYYSNTGDFNQHLDVREKINFQIKEAFEREGIEFAYPTQTEFIVGDSPKN